MNDADRRAKVKLAAKMLDEEVPGWHQMVDPATLEMMSCSACVLGQVFGWENEKRIRAIVDDNPYAHMSKHEKGFGIGREYLRRKIGYEAGHPLHGAFGADNCMWVEEIADRLAGDTNDRQ